MTIRNLTIFVAVCECGNMSKAAASLYITQSSVSQTVADIEREYNVVLFDRLKNGLYLTAIGQTMLSYAKNVLSVYSDLENVLKHESRSPRIRIGASATIGSSLIQQVVKLLCQCIPQLDYSVFVGNTAAVESMLLENSLDIGLVEGEYNSPDLKSERVTDDTLVLVCPNGHRFFGRKSISLTELEGEKMILREEGSGTRKQLEEQLRKLGTLPIVTWNCISPDVVRCAVKSGFGVSVISRRLIEEDLKYGNLWACDIEDAKLTRNFKLLYHKDKFFTAPMKEFVRICYDVVK